MHYQTCKAEYHSLSRQHITLVPTALVQYLSLTTRDILPYKLDNIILSHTILMQSLKYSFQTRKHICFVTEYYPGGDLMFNVRRVGKFDENRARFYGAEIILAIEYLHKLKILLRTLKVSAMKR